MILMISIALAIALLLLWGRALRARPAPFYIGAAALSALVIVLYWTAPAFLSPRLRTELPLLLGAFGTACFILVMYAGALPRGHSWMKRILPVRGELSIVACLLTLGHNLSYGKGYLTPGYLFSGPVTTTRLAAWVSVVLIALMLVLTVTSVKAVRRRIQPKRWKALQRWAYLFYALIYLHVLLLTIPPLLKGRTSYLPNLLVYSAVYLSYAVCRIQKAVLLRRGQQVTGRRQLAGAGVGLLLTLLLTACVLLPTGDTEPGAAPPADTAATEEPAQPDSGSTPPADTAAPTQEPIEAPEAEKDIPEAPPEQPTDTQPAPEPPPSPTEAAAPTPEPQPSPQPEAQPQPVPEPEPEPEPVSKYRDGTFTGTGEGYDGPVTVSVTISGDQITAITVDSYVDEDEYMNDAKSGVISAILLLQSTNVSAVSGATYSSEGIMDAVAAALREAEN